VRCREAVLGHDLDCPQQFGIWEVAGLGLVVAFRGTASQEDALIDMNIEPVPLEASRSSRGYCFCIHPMKASSNGLLLRSMPPCSAPPRSGSLHRMCPEGLDAAN
jgi:hypothetical protein